LEVLKQLCEAVHRKMPELWPNHWVFHHDNASAHRMLSLEQFLAQKSITEAEHLPSSSDLAPNYFWLFPEIKSASKGPKFQVNEDVQKSVMMALKAIP
jgi:hypothetical protein